MGLSSDCHPDCIIALEAVRMRPGEIEPRTRRWKKCVTLLDSKSPIQGTPRPYSATESCSLGSAVDSVFAATAAARAGACVAATTIDGARIPWRTHGEEAAMMSDRRTANLVSPALPRSATPARPRGSAPHIALCLFHSACEAGRIWCGRRRAPGKFAHSHEPYVRP